MPHPSGPPRMVELKELLPSNGGTTRIASSSLPPLQPPGSPQVLSNGPLSPYRPPEAVRLVPIVNSGDDAGHLDAAANAITRYPSDSLDSQSPFSRRIDRMPFFPAPLARLHSLTSTELHPLRFTSNNNARYDSTSRTSHEKSDRRNLANVPRRPASVAAGQRDVAVIARQIARALDDNPTAGIRNSRSLPEGTLFVDALSLSEMREHIFRDCLANPYIDCDELRRIVWAHGVPDRPWARPVAWKLLLGYLPPERVEWDNILRVKRAQYWELVAQLTIDPNVAGPPDDHPLRSDEGSRWAEFFRDKDLRALIDKDAVRTHADLHRFTPLRDPLRRILFVYVKSSSGPPGTYRQGMNELVAPILMVFAEAPFIHVSDAEADAFFCFQTIMSEMSRVYVVSESETVGVGRQIRELRALLRIKDPRLEAHLTQLGIDPRFFALRWIRVWLAREFAMPDLLRLWDSLFAADIRLPWIRYICVAMLIRIRAQLLAEDFGGSMKLLLNYPPCDIAELLQVADRLRTANVTIVRSPMR